MNAKAFWQKLRKIGWLDYVPPEQHDELRAQIETNLAGKDGAFVYLALAQGAFEARKTDAKRLLRELARVSGGKFTPKKVKVAKAKKSSVFELSFEHGEKRFSCEVAADCERLTEGDWTSILSVANKALKKNGNEQRFFILPRADDFVPVFLVPAAVFKAAEKAKLIPREEVWGKGDELMLDDWAHNFLSRTDPDFHNPRQALRLAKHAVALDPEEGAYKETVAAAYADLGEFEFAVHWQELALKDPKILAADGLRRLKAYQKKQPNPLPLGRY